MELPVTMIGERMHTMETARTTETGLMSCNRVSILLTVGMRVVVSSAKVVDDSSVSVANVDIVAFTATEEFTLIFSYAISVGSSFSHCKRALLYIAMES